MNKQSTLSGEQLAELLKLIGGLVYKGSTAFKSFREELSRELDTKMEVISKSVGEVGIDPFGMDPKSVRKALLGAAFLYKIYFRCLTRGIENVPKEGPVILVANHAGQIPIDAVMILAAILLEGDPPRITRSLADRWVPSLPFISTMYSRVGVTVGTTENAELLLARNEALLVFPEGMKAITKTIDQAYQLQDFGLGFMRLALSTKAPVVPIAVVGSEEQYPTLYNLKSVAKLLGIPSVPIWAQLAIPVLGMLPLPVRYHIDFGEPMTFEGDPDDEDAVIQVQVSRVKQRLAEMLENLRKQRRSIFW